MERHVAVSWVAVRRGKSVKARFGSTGLGQLGYGMSGKAVMARFGPLSFGLFRHGGLSKVSSSSVR